MKKIRSRTAFLITAGASMITVITLFTACTSSLLEKGGWEGIRGDILRVYVTLDIPEDMNAAAAPGLMAEHLFEAGKKRAEILLYGYTRQTVTDPERADSCRSLIPGIISAGRTAYRECGEDACSAFMDFDVKRFLETARGPAGR